MKLSVVIPVYNEETTLRDILQRVRETPFDKEIIMVDDCSQDGTRAILKKLEGDEDLKILYHEVNQGKGAALRTGFQHATGDVVLTQALDLWEMDGCPLSAGQDSGTVVCEKNVSSHSNKHPLESRLSM